MRCPYRSAWPRGPGQSGCARRARSPRCGGRPGCPSWSPGPQHHVADVDRGLDRLDATGPGAAAGLAGADMLGHPLHTLDDEAVGVLEDLQDASLLAAVATRDDDDKVALLDLGHGQSTSGANEMIFMNFLSRSSRPTGPKMRVPRGSLSTLRSTAAFSSNLMYEPSGRRRDLV